MGLCCTDRGSVVPGPPAVPRAGLARVCRRHCSDADGLSHLMQTAQVSLCQMGSDNQCRRPKSTNADWPK
eukprot:30533-Rhodomonas_salina.3